MSTKTGRTGLRTPSRLRPVAHRVPSAVHKERPSGVEPTAPWERRYARAVVAVDLVAVLASLALRELWGVTPLQHDLPQLLAVVVVGLAIVSLATARAWEPAVLGQGSEEFSRLLRGLVTAAVVLGLVGLAAKLPEVRPWVFGVIPLAGILAALGRLALRRGLHRRRRNGFCMHEVLAVGNEESVRELIERTRRADCHGWVVTAACTPTGAGTDGRPDILGVPVVGDLDAVAARASSGRHRVVSVAQSPGWSSRRLHQLAWDLEGSGTELVVDPGLMEIAGPRLHMAVVDGMPLLRLTEPRFSGLPRAVKNTVDRVAALALLVLTAPLFILIAVAVRLDGGPMFFRQTRIGQHGREFRMLKFRSMIVDAEARRAELLGTNEGAGPLFKMRRDPRVTRVGAMLRRYSLDELPQLLNVLVGQMSLIGPRPPLRSETEAYERDAQRRLLVKPGLTGLWQVSGRSDLSWDASVRLDLRYVENWSLALDALILWKTIGAVLRGGGAY